MDWLWAFHTRSVEDAICTFAANFQSARSVIAFFASFAGTLVKPSDFDHDQTTMYTTTCVNDACFSCLVIPTIPVKKNLTGDYNQ